MLSDSHTNTVNLRLICRSTQNAAYGAIFLHITDCTHTRMYANLFSCELSFPLTQIVVSVSGYVSPSYVAPNQMKIRETYGTFLIIFFYRVKKKNYFWLFKHEQIVTLVIRILILQLQKLVTT